MNKTNRRGIGMVDKKGISVFVLVIGIVLFLVLPSAIPVTATGEITATRDISSQNVTPGDTFTVTVAITANQEIEALALDEDLPNGWAVTQVSDDAAAFKESTTEWIWTEKLSTGNAKTVIYNVTVPSDANGAYYITGNVSAYQVSPIEVVGESKINVIGTDAIDQIMKDAKLIEKVQTNSTVNLSAIIDDSDFNATLQGDYAVWEEELDNYIYKGNTYNGFAGYNKSPLIIKIAVSKDGDFYLGTFNGTADDNLLIFSQTGRGRGIRNYRDFSGNLLDKSVYGKPHDTYLDLDARQNYLAYIFGEKYKNLYNKGYIKHGPKDYYELYNCNYSLENYFDCSITVIRSFICHQQFDYSWYNEKRRPIDEARNAKWSPIANNPDQNRDLSRIFNVDYQNVNESFVWIRTYTDNSMHSDITIYAMDSPPDYSCSGGSGGRKWKVTYDPNAKTYNVHNDNCAAAELFLDNQLPDRVQMEGYTTWSRLEQSITIAALGNITTSNYTESPSPGDDNNPAPMIWIIEPSKPAKQSPIANFTYSPPNPVVNQSVTFDASSSYDPDGGEITEYWWNVSGTVYTAQKFNHTFTNPGEKYVFLQVKDDEGDTNSTVKWIKVGPENWYAKDSYVKLISGTLANQDISSSNPEITVSPDKQISGSFDISVKNTGHSGSIFPIVATPNWGPHESSYWSITGHQAPSIKNHTVNVDLIAPLKPGFYYIIVAGQWELSAANVASGTNWGVGENHWNDGNDLGDWSTSKIEEAINSGLVIADWEKVDGMVKMYVPATAIRVKVVAEKPIAWLHSGYDLFNTRYYSYPSETAVSMNNFNLSWTSPNKGITLTGDVKGDGKLELVSAFEERICALDKDGNELWSRNVATDSEISGAKVNSMDLADMDGDNIPEIVLGISPAVTYPGVNKPLRIIFYDGDGDLLKTISTPDSHRINVKSADLDGDGTKEVIAAIYAWYTLKPRGVYIYDYTTGNELWHYNVGPQIRIDAIADINNDGYKEIIVGSFAPHNGNSDHGTDDSHSYVFCFDKDGNNLWTKQIGCDSVHSSVADLDGNGNPEIISFRNQNEPHYPGPNDVYILNPANGNILDTYNGPSNKGWKGWSIVDINRDNKKEIVVGNRDGKLRVLNHNLNLINSNSISGTVQAINDINGDRKEEIIVCTDNKRIVILDTDLSKRFDYELGANGNAIVSDLIPSGTNEIIVSADKLYVLNGGITQSPIANFTYSPPNPVVSQSVTFDASSSYDPDGTIVSYEWKFGDGNISNTTIPTITHSYQLAGNYNVTLTVTDNASAKSSTSKVVAVPPSNISTVSFKPPVINITSNFTNTMNVTLDTAPNGLSGYNITISLSNANTAEITSVKFLDWATLHSNSSLPDDSLWIKAADLDDQIKSGAMNITLATLTIRGDKPGTSNICTAVKKMNDDNGNSINPNTIPGTIVVTSVTPLPDHINPPTDPDGDGLYEDINGNGMIDFDDIVQFFKYMEWIENNEPIHCFDFNKNDHIDFDDIVKLFEEI